MFAAAAATATEEPGFEQVRTSRIATKSSAIANDIAGRANAVVASNATEAATNNDCGDFAKVAVEDAEGIVNMAATASSLAKEDVTADRPAATTVASEVDAAMGHPRN